MMKIVLIMDAIAPHITVNTVRIIATYHFLMMHPLYTVVVKYPINAKIHKCAG